MTEEKKKASKKDRKKEMRELDRELQGGTGVDYSKISDRHVDDKRFERELEHKRSLEAAPYVLKSESDQTAPSATYDAFIRMQTGQNERTIADKINDPNRVTWDHFKKINADKLDLVGNDLKNMVEYRKQLDRDRAGRMSSQVRRKKDSSSNSTSSESDSSSLKRKHRKLKKRRKKEERKEGKKKRKKDSSQHQRSPNSTDSHGSRSIEKAGKKDEIEKY